MEDLDSLDWRIRSLTSPVQEPIAKPTWQVSPWKRHRQLLRYYSPTRFVGIRYRRVETLSITQDDTKDWELKSSPMASATDVMI
jgi:hypothetical protein